MAEIGFVETSLTFTPEFNEFITLYRGIENVWIGDNTTANPGDKGVLYAKYVDGAIQTVGPVSAYYYALQNGYEGTFSQWVQTLLDATTNAQAAAASASAAAASAESAESSAEYAGTYRNDASYYADVAKSWAVYDTLGSPSETNNAKYYATDASASASSASTYANNAASSAQLATAKAESIKAATTDITYMNSDDGVNHPSESSQDWSSTPNPIQGKYLWTKIVLTWMDNTTSVIYNVSYAGANGINSVTSINGKTGTVTLYATDIDLSSSDSTDIDTAISQKAPSVSPSFSGGATVASGNLTVSNGNIVLSTGNITVSSGSLTIGDQTIDASKLGKMLSFLDTIDLS